MKNLLESLTSKNSGLRSRSEKQVTGEANKYLVILWNQKEQVVAFPNCVQHAEVFKYTKQEAPHIELVSAGFSLADGDALWAGGRSESPDVDSRQQNTDLLKSFLTSPGRSLWDLTLLAVNGGAK